MGQKGSKIASSSIGPQLVVLRAPDFRIAFLLALHQPLASQDCQHDKHVRASINSLPWVIIHRVRNCRPRGGLPIGTRSRRKIKSELDSLFIIEVGFETFRSSFAKKC